MTKDAEVVDRFVQACVKVQPELHIRSEPFFRGIVAIPISQEYLLQAYFVLNLSMKLERNATLILYESSLPEEKSHRGKVDLILLTDENKLLVMESKYIDHHPGRTKRSSRTEHRKKVREQVNSICSKLMEDHQIPSYRIERAILTNDEKMKKEEGGDIKVVFVSDSDLETWRELELAGMLPQSIRGPE